METRFKKKSQIFDIVFTGIGAVLSVGVMLYGVIHFGLSDAWNELVLNLFYIACLVMMVLYFFKRIDTQRFNYWSSICVGITVLLRDILFPPHLENYPLHLVCLTLSVLLLLMLTFFYSRKDWKSYTKGNLWMLFVIDMVIAGLYHYVIVTSPTDEYTNYLLTEIWIRPTLIYGLVACFVSGKEEQEMEAQAQTQASAGK
ncbi:MAG: hypothetical protein J6B53_06745 [Clostridia bacterium]|nr:hypothetical protein [Clostridia bacterium]